MHMPVNRIRTTNTMMYGYGVSRMSARNLGGQIESRKMRSSGKKVDDTATTTSRKTVCCKRVVRVGYRKNCYALFLPRLLFWLRASLVFAHGRCVRGDPVAIHRAYDL